MSAAFGADLSSHQQQQNEKELLPLGNRTENFRVRNCLLTDSSVSDFETILDTAHFVDEQIAASSSKSN